MLSLDQALAELPDTAEGIAAFLGEKESRGKRCDGWQCPMASYLTSLGFPDPFVQPDFVQVKNEDGWGYQEPPTPIALRDFIERFDDGEWPELAVTDA